MVELGAKRRIRAGGHVPGRQLLDRGDESLGDEASAVRAEIASRVGVAPAENWTFCCDHAVHPFSYALRAPARNCATSARSFTPGDSSTPDDTSTPYGCTVA